MKHVLLCKISCTHILTPCTTNIYISVSKTRFYAIIERAFKRYHRNPDRVFPDRSIGCLVSV